MDHKIEELKKDIEEFTKLQDLAVRQRVKDSLGLEKRRLESDLSALLQNQANSAVSGSSLSTTPKRYLVELTNYAFDQSDAFVKLFVTLDGVQKVSEEGVTVEFTEKSVNLKVEDLDGKDYSLVVRNLLESVDVEKSYRRIKSDMIVIYMKKVRQGRKWDYLTSTEKRIKDTKNSALADPGDDADAKDPSAGIMNMMKKMYESGDPDTKRMIAKAWTESQEKRDAELQPPQF